MTTDLDILTDPMWTPTDAPYDRWRRGAKWERHYVGDHAGVWYVSVRDPERKQSKRQPTTLLEDFKALYPKRLDAVRSKFNELAIHIEAHPEIERRVERMARYFREEIEILRASFERNCNGRYRIATAKDICNLGNPVVILEGLFAELLFQLDQLRNCAKQNSYTYTLEDLVDIYASLDDLADKLIRYSKGYTAVEWQTERDI
jgi:hypothetical protein